MAVRNNGLRKVCGCRKTNWTRCAHTWHFNFKPRGGPPFRFSLDAELGRHIDNKTEAEKEARNIRSAILAGTFERAADRRAREQREAEEAARRPTSGSVVTFDAYIKIYVERASQASGKTTWKADKWLLGKVAGHLAADGRRLGDMPIAAITEDELEAFHASLVTAGRAASTRNHYVHLIKAAFRWAARKGYITRSPISDDSALVRSKHAQRARRITPREEAALLKAARELTRGAGVRAVRSDRRRNRDRLSSGRAARAAMGGRRSRIVAKSESEARTPRTRKPDGCRSRPVWRPSWKWPRPAQTARSTRQAPTCSESSANASSAPRRRGRPACFAPTGTNPGGPRTASSVRNRALPYARSICASTTCAMKPDRDGWKAAGRFTT